MATEPSTKKTIAFIDGQNLFHCAKKAFGHLYPNYDPLKLAKAVCAQKGWDLKQVRFYTGVPSISDSPRWHRFWANKLTAMGKVGVHIFRRELRYRNETVTLPDGSLHAFLTAKEKGIDVRIALDIIKLAHRKCYDVALIFSQDQDLSEVAEEIREIAKEQGRWINMTCAFPDSPTVTNRRGINKTDWIRIDRATYNSCLDSRDYRPKSS